MTNRKRFKKGFTLAEVLITVSIIIILSAFSFVGVTKYKRNLSQLELDNYAKELFIAAQNRLSMANSQSYPGITDFGTEDTVTTDADDNDIKNDYYILVDSEADLNASGSLVSVLLPFGSIDDAVRTGGNYIIRYDKASAKVLDVFYSDNSSGYTFKASDYANCISSRGDAHKNYGKTYLDDSKILIGYYGGVAAEEIEKGSKLNAPNLEVSNAEKLTLTVTNAWNTDADLKHDAYTLKLVIHGLTSDVYSDAVVLIDSGTALTNASSDFIVESTGTTEFVVDLDDITSSGKHFADMFCSSADAAKNFIPGENLEIKVVAYNNSAKTNVAESNIVTVNSLFDNLELNGADQVVAITNFRHLENLSENISGFNPDDVSADYAAVYADLDWSDFKANVAGGSDFSIYYSDDTTGTVNCYLPVSQTNALSFNGFASAIRNVKVRTGGDAGLFGSLPAGSEIKAVELVGFDISTTGGNAGALLGKGSSVSITDVLVHNETDTDDSALEISASSNAGGLVGQLNGGSVSGCAAAVYVKSSSANAGGLIGQLTGSVTITDSYSGGHTKNRMYSDETSGAGRVNVIASSAAGGFIGDASASSFNISYCYSTCSSKASLPGGFIGKGGMAGSKVKNSYCTGKVISSNAEAVVGQFIGSVQSTTFEDGRYLENISEKPSPAKITGVTGYKFDDFKLSDSQQAQAVAYDYGLVSACKGHYFYRTIRNLHGDYSAPTSIDASQLHYVIHYGDWPDDSGAFRVFYDLNAGLDSSLSPEGIEDKEYYKTGDTVRVSRIVPARRHYGFDGWALTADATEANSDYDPGDTFEITEDVTLYAVWSVRPYYIDITVYKDGVLCTDVEDLATRLSVYDSEHDKYTGVFKNDEKDGVYTAYVNNGTYKIFVDGFDTGHADIVVDDSSREARLNLYTLSVDVYKDDVLWTGDGAPTVSKLVRSFPSEDKVFTGASSVLAPEGSTWRIYLSDSSDPFHVIRSLNGKTSLKANYYSLIFDSNAAQYSLTESSITGVPATKVVKAGTIVELGALPKYGDGTVWGCQGWSKNKTATTASFITGDDVQVNGKTTLYAIWSNQKYALTYNMNFYSGSTAAGGQPVDSRSPYLAGSYATILGNENNVSRSGYYFVGWNTKSDGTGTTYLEGDSMLITKDQTLYALWGPNGAYTVIYEKNGANGGRVENSWIFVDSTDVYHQLNENKFTRNNYQFKGWATTAVDEYVDGDPTWTYTDKQKVAVSELKSLAVNNVIRLYATWQQKTSYTVSFHLNYMGKGTSSTIAYKDEDYVAKLTCEGGYNPPQSASSISVYVDYDRNGLFGDGEKLVSYSQYDWDPYTMELTIPGEYVQGDIKIVASAIAGKHTISYYRNYTGSGSSTADCTTVDSANTTLDSSATYTYGTYITVPAGPSRDNHIFVSWNTEFDGSGDKYLPGDVLHVEHNQRLYAQWKHTDIVGAYIYNYYTCYETSASDMNTYLRKGSVRTDYVLIQGESQTTVDGETYDILNNGGQPYYTKPTNTPEPAVNTTISNSTYKYNITYDTARGSVSAEVVRQNNTDYVEITVTPKEGYGIASVTSNRGTVTTMSAGVYRVNLGNNTRNITVSFNGSGPARYNFQHYYAVKLPKDVSGYKVYYQASDNSSWTEASLTSGWFTDGTKLTTDTRYPNSSNEGSLYDYYYFAVGSTNYLPRLTAIKVSNTVSQTDNIFDFVNNSRPQNSSNPQGTVTASSAWHGITGVAARVAVHNGNVPTLDREYANFYKKTECQAEFTVTPDVNKADCELSYVTLENEAGALITTAHTLYTESDGVLTFQPDAMNELEPGDYTVTVRYTNYENDPTFVLHVYNESVEGYRYIRMNINQVCRDADTGVKVQFSEIGFATDKKGVNPYRFEDSSVIYDLSAHEAYENEDAYLCVDNNTRTKFCSVDTAGRSVNSNINSGSWTLVFDTGDGYQLNSNLYGYVSYYTAGDTWSWGRSPMNFTYYGSNNSSVVTSKTNATGNANWNSIINMSLSYTYASNGSPSYNNVTDADSYVLNQVMVQPQNNKYNLTYDLNGGTYSGNIADENISQHYGDVIVTYAVPSKAGQYFLGWSEDRYATEATYQGGEHYTLLYTTTLYAVYSDEAPIFALNYYPNTSANVTAFPNNSYVYGGTNKLSTILPTAEGLRFTNWTWMMTYRDTDGVDKVKPITSTYSPVSEYLPGADINIVMDTLLYANWAEGYTVTMPEEDGFGIVSPAAKVTPVNRGSSFTFEITPHTGFSITDVGYTGTAGTMTHSGNTYTIPNIQSDIVVKVTAKSIKTGLTITTDGHASVTAAPGFVSPTKNGNTYTVDVSYRGAYGFIVTPDTGYAISTVTGIDAPDKIVGSDTYYSVKELIENKTVTITTSRETYQVHFNANADSVTGTMDNQKIACGSLTQLQENAFERSGYVFKGWATTADGEVEYTDKQEVNLSSTADEVIELYAKWTAGWRVRFFDFLGNLISKVDVEPNGTATAPSDETIKRTGYNFKGWSSSASSYSAVSLENVSANIDAYAAYDPKTYTITLSPNNGGTDSSTTATYDSSVLSPAVSSPVRTGYSFAGWANASDAITISAGNPGILQANVSGYTGENGIWQKDADVTLTGKWNPNTYTITFMSAGEEKATQSVVFDTTPAVPSGISGLTRTGYKLTGWYTSGNGLLLNSSNSYVQLAGYIDNNNKWVKASDVTVTAKWEGYKLTLQSNVNEVNGSKEYSNLEYNTITSLTGYTLGYWQDSRATNKYTLDGWYTAQTNGNGSGTKVINADGTVVSGTVSGYTNSGKIALTADKTLYAKWIPVQHTITFNTNGGSAIAPITKGYGEAITAPANPTRTGYRFSSWNAAIPATMPDHDVTLTASWTAITYKVRFNRTSGSGTMADETFTYDSAKALTENAFTKTGYTFAGWATSNGGAKVYDNKQSVMNLASTQDAVVNLYAVWTANTYTVKFNANGGSGTMADETFTYDSAKALTQNAFTRTGYTFAGWATSASGDKVYNDKQSVSNLTSTANGVVNLYAKWTPVTYEVRFNANGGSGTMANEPFTYDAAEKALTQNAFTRTGYTFAGWATSSTGAKVYNDKQAVKNLANTQGAVVDLYAKWTANTYTVTFNANGGSGTMADESFTYDVSKALTSNGFTAPAGYTFAGWATTAGGNAVYTDGQSVSNLTATNNGTVTLYAKWAPITYSVVFHGNDSTGGLMSNQTMTYGQSAALTANGFSRTGYTFAGWATSASGDKVYNNQQTVTNLASTQGATVDLYAKWTPITYTVVFNKTDGSGTMASETFTYDESKALNANGFTAPQCYKFAGWATSASGNKVYDDQQVVSNLTATNGATVNLYAKWEAKSYTVTLKASESTFPDGSNEKTISVTINSYSTLRNDSDLQPGNPRLTRRFSGWKDDLTNQTLQYSEDVFKNIIRAHDAAGHDSFTLNAAYSTGCIAPGTLITMADGTKLPVEDIKLGDLIQSYDFATGNIVASPVVVLEHRINVPSAQYKVVLDNDTEIDTILFQSFFDMDSREYFRMTDENFNELVGRRIMVMNDDSIGSAMVVNVVAEDKVQDTYDVVTAYTYNFFANDTLTCVPVLLDTNIFEITEDYIYDPEKMEADIRKYGLYDENEFAAILTKEEFDYFNGGYFKIAVEKGIIPYDYIVEIIKLLIEVKGL